MYNREDIQEFLRTRVARPASAGVVIYNDKKEALVLKANYKPYWSFPGGWIEDNQTPIQAAVRELSEETGILIIPQRLKFLYIINRVSNIMQSYQFIFEYSGMIDDFTSIKLQPEEIDDYKFVSREEVLINLNNYDKIDIVACGSAYHAGMIGKYILEDKLDVRIDVASEYRYRKHLDFKNSLLILISQSGETADTLACLSNEKNIDSLGIVNVETSRLARETKYQMFLKCGSEVAVATTKAYLSQVLMMKLLRYRLDNDYQKALEYFNKLLINIPKNLKFNYEEIIKLIAKQKKVFFIGRLIDYAISLEASLKLKEISYINAESYPAGELKHGTISLIEKNTVVIGIITDEEMALKTSSNLIEVKARGAITIAVVKKNLKELVKADYYIETPEEVDLLTIIKIQLLSYYVADLLNREIDKPRNLAKSVTVE